MSPFGHPPNAWPPGLIRNRRNRDYGSLLQYKLSVFIKEALESNSYHGFRYVMVGTYCNT